jgi:hypothetical protein
MRVSSGVFRSATAWLMSASVITAIGLRASSSVVTTNAESLLCFMRYAAAARWAARSTVLVAGRINSPTVGWVTRALGAVGAALIRSAYSGQPVGRTAVCRNDRRRSVPGPWDMARRAPRAVHPMSAGTVLLPRHPGTRRGSP